MLRDSAVLRCISVWIALWATLAGTASAQHVGPAAVESASGRPDLPLLLSGDLFEADGAPVQGEQNLVIRFFDDPKGREVLQVVLASHPENPVPDGPVFFTDGAFRIELGAAHSIAPGSYGSPAELLAAQPTVWMSIVRGTDSETPRLPMKLRNGSLVPADGRKSALTFILSREAWTAEQVTLATFQLPNDGQLEFVALPELGEVGVVESFPVEHGLRFTTEDVDPLELYLALAPSDLPVPQALMWNAEDPELAAGRMMVDRMVEPVLITEEAVAFLSKIPDYPTNHFCGADRQDAFEVVCNSYNTGGINFCESGNWYSVIRNSYSGGWQKKKKQSAIIGSCNTSVSVKLRYRGLCGFSYCWKNASSYTVGYGKSSGNVYNGAVKRRRRNEYSRNDSGYFRAHTSFY